ncbi:MAG: nucleoid-associated protein [Allosphingosinicella sp.]
MTLIAPEQLDDITIERMIFHVVGPEGTPLVLLEEIEPGEHAAFFVDRLRSAANGVMFDFVAASPVLASLRRIEEQPNRFASETKDLATLFNEMHTGAASVGVFLVFALRVGEERLYAMVKYDHEEVLSYTIQEEDDVRRALIAALESTFVRSPDALQKAAIIRLTGAGGELSVRDRVAPSKITRYFQSFLGARRRFQSDQLTSTLSDITKKTARRHADELGANIMGQLNRRVYEAVQAQPGFDPANREPFLAAVFGPLPEESPVRRTFDKELRNNRIESEVFDFDKDAVPRPRRKHLVTNEGIEVIYDRQYDDRITREPSAGGGERIVIETGGVRVEDDYAEPRSRVR